jgi:hypothetical protein
MRVTTAERAGAIACRRNRPPVDGNSETGLADGQTPASFRSRPQSCKCRTAGACGIIPVLRVARRRELGGRTFAGVTPNAVCESEGGHGRQWPWWTVMPACCPFPWHAVRRGDRVTATVAFGLLHWFRSVKRVANQSGRVGERPMNGPLTWIERSRLPCGSTGGSVTAFASRVLSSRSERRRCGAASMRAVGRAGCRAAMQASGDVAMPDSDAGPPSRGRPDAGRRWGRLVFS